MTVQTTEKGSGGKGFWFALAALIVANLLVGTFLAPRGVHIEHAPIVRLPNFLASMGVPGEFLPSDVLMTWFVMAFLVGVGVLGVRELRAVPGPLQNLVEVTIEGFWSLLDQMIGRHGREFLPLVGSAGLFILASNLLGNIPGFRPPTADWNTTVALSITVFIWYNYAGIRQHGFLNYLRHFCGPIWWLAPIMFPIEFIGHLARPISLSVRLFGNIFGEESVITILLSLNWLVMPYFIWLGVMLPLSLFTATVQTFVFIMLTMVYIAGAVEEGHGEKLF
jgi:F-type H+-transporting ATPase subunit a